MRNADWSTLPLGKRPAGRWALAARYVIADMPEGRRLINGGEVVIENDRIIWVGSRFDGELAARYDMGEAARSRRDKGEARSRRGSWLP